jgi:hypothetical protein
VSRLYRVEPLRLRLFYAIAAVSATIGLLLALFFFWVVADLGLDLIGLIVVALPILLFGGIALAIALAARSIRLELSEGGVTLHLVGSQMATGWDDIESIGRVAWGPLSGDAPQLRRPVRVNRAWWFPLFAGSEYEFAIPLSPFALPLSGSRLEADLRSRIPEIFERQPPNTYDPQDAAGSA